MRKLTTHTGSKAPRKITKSASLPQGIPNDTRLGNDGYDPVPLFDNLSIDSRSQIELLTIPDVARLLKISVSGVRRLYQDRRLPFVKVGGSVRFLASDIKSYLTRQRVQPID
jgi:excisionase family DNA binding protein